MIRYAFMNGIILDGTENMEPIRDHIILTQDDKIVDIVPNGSDIGKYEMIDLGGKYIMPGLINMHVHLPANGKPKDKKTDPVKLVRILTSNFIFRSVVRRMCENYARTELMSGVTTIRTMGGVLDYDSLIRERVKLKYITGPRIIAADKAISVPGGHMADSLAWSAKNVDEVRQYAEKIFVGQPNLLKIMVTGGVLDAKVKGEPGELKMPPEFIRAACEEAHRRKSKVAAHVESPEGLRAALENGVDTIEHGAKPDDEIIELFKKSGASLVATLSPALPYALFPREISKVSETEQYNGKVVFDGIIECAKKCLENGIPVGLGTDTGCPYVTHYDMWRELCYFKKYCGVSNSFALHTATLVNAKIAGIDSITGSIAAGKCADFIVTERNPLDDLTALRNVDMVITCGQMITKPCVKKFPEVEQELDKYL